MTSATPQQRLDFLITETRKALAIVNRIDIAAYVQKVEANEPMALALFAVSDIVASALHFVETEKASAHEVHNASAGDIVRQIVRQTLAAGGEMTDVMVLLESVVTGVMLVAVKLGGDDKVLPTLVAGVEQRLAEARLAPIKPEGRA